MTISETKMQMVIANYFKDECDVNTSIRQAFEKGFRIGVKKGASTNRPQGEWIYCEDYVGHDGYKCSECGFFVPWAYDCYADSNFILNYHTCPHCDARMKGADDESTL